VNTILGQFILREWAKSICTIRLVTVALHRACRLLAILKKRLPKASINCVGCTVLFALSMPMCVPLRAEEPISPIPLANDGDPLRVDLGRRLFSDEHLSHNNTFSCASCHPLNGSGIDKRARAVGADGKTLLRNTPTIFNLRFNLYLNWDGAHETLQRHTEAVLKNPALMDSKAEDLVAKFSEMPIYYGDFKNAYPQGLDKASLIDAIVSYVRSLTTPNARFDRYLRGDLTAITADELRGYQLFKSNGCIACHQGTNVGGNLLQRFGVFASPQSLGTEGDGTDFGRFRVSKDPNDKGVFRVPSLRNVAVTGPYFHDGRTKTLEEAIWVMARAQLGRILSGDEIRLIAAFLGTLTGELEGKALSAQAGGDKK
jgi:cytochrome c peroxidase